ncbi:MAG: hypothetical protein J7K20_03680 [Thermodesulfobacterium sp.]|nr:hypothetical protein [Thermodesulfobacterium sp.]
MNAGFNFAATKRLTIFGDAYYVYSEEDYDRPYLGSIDASDNPWSEFDVSDYSDLQSYEFRVSGGFTYNLKENLTVQVKATYADFDEDEYYMQDRDADVVYVTAGVKWNF